MPRPRTDYAVDQQQADTVVRQILDREQAKLQAFCQEMRQQVAMTGVAFVTQERPFTQVVMRYSFNTGQETIDLTVSPEFPVISSKPKCMVVFHSTNKITAIPMPEVEGFTEDTEFSVDVELTLRHSSWEDKLIRCCQLRLSEDLSTLLLSPLVIDDSRRVTKSETHHLVRADGEKGACETFFATSTSFNRTPFLNGSGKECFVARDKFEVTDDGLKYRGLDGTNQDVSVIAPDGVRYYKPVLWAWRGFGVQPTDAFEVAALDFNATDDQLDAYEAEWNAVTYGNQAIMDASFMFNMDGVRVPEGDWTVLVGAPWQHLGGMTYQNATTGFLIDGFYMLNKPVGLSGYGIGNGTAYTTTFLFAGYTGGLPSSPITPDISMDMPMSVFSQTDGLDSLRVEMVPATADVSYSIRDDGGDPVDVWVSSLTFLHYSYTQNFDFVLGDLGSTPVYPPKSTDEIFGSQAWFVTFPPALNLDPGGYYFADTGVLRTPYGEWPYVQSGGDGSQHPLSMHNVYKPWLHLSNGKTAVQGFEIDGTRLVFIWPAEDAGGTRGDPLNAVAAIEKATKVTVDQIQAIWLDTPLDIVRQLN